MTFEIDHPCLKTTLTQLYNSIQKLDIFEQNKFSLCDAFSKSLSIALMV